MTNRRLSRFGVTLVLFVSALSIGAGEVRAQAREEARILVATQVVEQQRGDRDQAVPDWLLERAFGIAIVPEVKKGAFGVGVQGGKGVLMVRDKQGRFGQPAFVTLVGGSFGWQAGVQSTDLLLVFTTRKGVEGITDGKVKLGVDASAAAGPVGRSASAATDVQLAEIYSYSRSSGLFAGIALDGTVIAIDKDANSRFYAGGGKVATADILAGTVAKDSESVRRLQAAVAARTAPRSGAKPAAAPAAAPSAAPPAAPSAPAAPAAPGAQTFPMEDAKPGQEPPR
jgi:lipid-binding SYLF domain-containing protein